MQKLNHAFLRNSSHLLTIFSFRLIFRAVWSKKVTISSSTWLLTVTLEVAPWVGLSFLAWPGIYENIGIDPCFREDDINADSFTSRLRMAIGWFPAYAGMTNKVDEIKSDQPKYLGSRSILISLSKLVLFPQTPCKQLWNLPTCHCFTISLSFPRRRESIVVFLDSCIRSPRTCVTQDAKRAGTTKAMTLQMTLDMPLQLLL